MKTVESLALVVEIHEDHRRQQVGNGSSQLWEAAERSLLRIFREQYHYRLRAFSPFRPSALRRPIYNDSAR